MHHVHRAHDLCEPRVHTVNAAAANRRINHPSINNAVIFVPVDKSMCSDTSLNTAILLSSIYKSRSKSNSNSKINNKLAQKKPKIDNP